jgi:SnoaL-like domain
VNPEEWMQVNLLQHRYAQIVDGGGAVGLGECFTEDAVFDSVPHLNTPDFLFPVRGREEIVAAIHERQLHWHPLRRVHMITNLVPLDEEPGRIRTLAAMVVLHTSPGSAPEVKMMGSYENEMVRESDGIWRIAHCIVHRENPIPAK